ncbi:hypothetical protein BUALT_Bualt09G0038200 [Buddleja alternifolia]|uniref:RING-type E3 ubiquitin transferase n=1 Tax=Buddleja alternifolia TaxID=168488 RepID=A0AAV6X0Z6_9LAMI|nr:hypothetical protein BUALT_Bualt09G0038200 [Buddleja alternifolia]
MVMGDPPSPHPIIHPPPSTPSNLAMLYYGLIIIGTAAFVLVLYNLIITKCCTVFTVHRAYQRSISGQGPTSSWRFDYFNSMNFISSFKYKKDGVLAQDEGDGFQCAVCLSVFEEGEELRQLPKCKHSFHAPCIDMWLYSHMDCPLCRSKVGPSVLERRKEMEQSEHSREGLLGPGFDGVR